MKTALMLKSHAQINVEKRLENPSSIKQSLLEIKHRRSKV